MKKFIIKWGNGEIQHLEEIHQTLVAEKKISMMLIPL